MITGLHSHNPKAAAAVLTLVLAALAVAPAQAEEKKSFFKKLFGGGTEQAPPPAAPYQFLARALAGAGGKHQRPVLPQSAKADFPNG